MQEEVEDFYISERVGHHFYSDNETFITVAVDPSMPDYECRALELEIQGHKLKGVKDGQRTCLKRKHELDFNRQTINLIKIALDDYAPSWVEEVKDYAHLTNDVRKLARFLGESTNVTQAAVEILRDRSELPEDFTDA
ncbi:hypothetical protein [Rubrobacter indicoceani]|uniref:hypothetical protein n=1 Tax=Rubrobacter indicoceani TaxID=2051957 RepID=UPI000E5BE55E|nr:hypothetical protein [Rubrobacter indicoceani]